MATEPDDVSIATRAAVLMHIDAFNAHSTGRLLDGFADDAVWMTGTDTVSGTDALRDLFDDLLWRADPSLEVRSLAVDGTSAAAELVERLTVDGELRMTNIAVFFDVRDALIHTGKVYREGSASVD